MMTRFETEAQSNSETIIAIIRSNHYEGKNVMKQSETSRRGWGERQSRFWQSQAWENWRTLGLFDIVIVYPPSVDRLWTTCIVYCDFYVTRNLAIRWTKFTSEGEERDSFCSFPTHGSAMCKNEITILLNKAFLLIKLWFLPTISTQRLAEGDEKKENHQLSDLLLKYYQVLTAKRNPRRLSRISQVYSLFTNAFPA